VEIIDLRHFTSADLRPLLQEETEVWSDELAWDYSSSADMILRYVDARILPGYAAVERGRLHGYAFFVYEGNKGVIGDLYVGQEHAPNGKESPVEKKLVTHVLETLQESPGVHRIEAQLLLHETGRVAGPFLHQGFQRYPRLFMELALAGHVAPAGERLPACCGTDYRVLSRAHRFADQRPVPYGAGSAALPEQHRALSRLRSFRRQFVVRCHRSRDPGSGGTDSLFAGERQHRARDAGMRSTRASR